MAEVPEIQLDIQNNAEEIPDNVVDKIDKVEIPDLPDIEEVPKPKARGRPKGAANKGPSKPRAKKAPVPPPQAEVPVYEPSSPKRNLSIPSYDRTDELASQMLRLLAGQAQDRQQKKRDLYVSWMR
jgi:hypothetical protein